ncbi:hypothetical protein DRO44_02290 [Candidatus Bathyarchaeota archaeon]|nr:MAG: hypothetical protein DRO44_02290 [Candidatus Bathyarchaeota archaeon]HDD69925.1 hypothetical protein [Candidatus Bathyarchaeota archaeon]
MPTTADLLTIIEEKTVNNIKQLAKETGIPQEKLHTILTNLSHHNLIEYSPKTGQLVLPKWLIRINQKIEREKPAVGEIILPKYKEIQIQDMLIGNYTGNDLELKIRLKTKRKEIAICSVT